MGNNASGNTLNPLFDERYRQIINQVEDYGILTLDNDGLISSWNVGAKRVLGFQEEDVLGAHFKLIFTPEDRDAGVPERELETARIEGSIKEESWHVRKDGSRFWTSGVLSALHDNLGTPDGFSKILRDMTQQHQAEEERERLVKELKTLNETLEEQVETRTRELKQSQERFYQAFNVGPVAGCITTLGMPDEEVFFDVNDAFLTLTGYTREDVVDKTAKAMYMWSSPEDYSVLRKLGDDPCHNQELTLRTRWGEVLTILLSRVVVGVNGERLNLKQFYDISARKRNETHLKAALQRVMSDTQWFTERVMEEIATVQVGDDVIPRPRVQLSAREREVLERIARGLGNDAIAEELGLRTQTVRNYISAIYTKIGVNSRTEAVVWARERGMS